MELTLQALAEKIGATLSGGSAGAVMTGVAPLDIASDRQVSFFSNPRYLDEARRTRAGAVITGKDLDGIPAARLVTPNPYLAWSKTVALFAPDRAAFVAPGRHPSAVIDGTASIGGNVHVGAHVFIGANTRIGPNAVIHAGAVIEENCDIGERAEIHPNAVVHYGSVIGRRCVVWSGAVIGGYGFGYAQDGPRFVRIHQLGNVVLEDDVEIGACATVDRGAVGPTRVKRGTKIDNLVQIAHNVEIGEDAAVAAQAGISGSVVIGDRVKVAGQVGFVGHIEIGKDSFVGAQAGVAKSFPEKSTITGYPARNLMDVRRSDAVIAKLPALAKKIAELEERINKLEKE